MVMLANRSNEARLRKCRSCGNNVSFYAKFCPHCGDKDPGGKGCGCLLLFIIFILIIFPMILNWIGNSI